MLASLGKVFIFDVLGKNDGGNRGVERLKVNAHLEKKATQTVAHQSSMCYRYVKTWAFLTKRLRH